VRDIAVIAARVPQQREAAGERGPLAPGVDLVAVVATAVDERADAEQSEALAEVGNAIAVIAGLVEEQRGARERHAETRALHLVEVVAREIEQRGQAAHREIGAAVAVVALKVDDHRDPTADRRRPVVDVVAAGVEDQRRGAVPIVAARADDHRTDRRFEAGRLGPVARRAHFAHEAGGDCDEALVDATERFAIDGRADLELRVGAEHAATELLEDLRLVERPGSGKQVGLDHGQLLDVGVEQAIERLRGDRGWLDHETPQRFGDAALEDRLRVEGVERAREQLAGKRWRHRRRWPLMPQRVVDDRERLGVG
jgi:hypothetical protein